MKPSPGGRGSLPFRTSREENSGQVQKDEFDIAYQEGTMFLLTMHPHYIGHRSRIVVLEELITCIQSKDKVWFGTHREAAEYVRAEAGMK